MPLGRNVRYRFKTTSSGKKIRLAFKGNKVVEATPFKRGSRGKLVKASAPKRVNAVAKRVFNL